MKNARLYKEALRYLPGGVNSPVRAFRGVGGTPIFARRGRGASFQDEEGRTYLDLCMSWGALLFGHAPAGLVRDAARVMKDGTSFGIATAREVELAREVLGLFPSMELMRFVSSGTEAAMSAVRLARGFTGRDTILKIDGGYHGHCDSMLVKAGSGGATFGVPDSAGVPREIARHTVSIPFNDFKSLKAAFQKYGRSLAALVLEPVPANMGVILPRPGYLEACRSLTRHYGALLVFDEVITGFRVAPGGAQACYKIKPDLTCLGKILGGGFPIAAFGGRREIMQKLAPLGPVYQAGTLSGNPVAVTAALWMVRQIKKESRTSLKMLGHREAHFYAALHALIHKKKWPVQLTACASMFTLFFSGDPVTDYASAKKSDTSRYARFFHACLKQGVYLAPSQFEANFLSVQHSEPVTARLLKVFKRSFLTVFS